jgi:hypothetical protein
MANDLKRWLMMPIRETTQIAERKGDGCSSKATEIKSFGKKIYNTPLGK